MFVTSQLAEKQHLASVRTTYEAHHESQAVIGAAGQAVHGANVVENHAQLFKLHSGETPSLTWLLARLFQGIFQPKLADRPIVLLCWAESCRAAAAVA